MRGWRIGLVLLLAGGIGGQARSAPLGHPEDAALRAIQMVDDKEGWAVGDDGVLLHTLDGGATWERRPTGLRASLRAVCFQTPYIGWVVGREELPQGGSVGVLLATRDGGCTWKALYEGALPGLNRIYFTDAQNGFLLGDGTGRFPSGLYQTCDGGRTWKPVAGPACPSWLAGCFWGAEGVLSGVGGRLGVWRQGTWKVADMDDLGGRSVQAVAALSTGRLLAAGQGGLVLCSQSRGAAWGFVDLHLPAAVQIACDWYALATAGTQVWIAGRPGSVVLHSPDGGHTWELQKTGQYLPLYGIYFLDGQRGWAVGELGTILHTRDGGRTWQVQRQGGQQAAVLFLMARPGQLPLETIALLGEEEGYLAAAVQGVSATPSAVGQNSIAAARLSLALRRAGGAAGEVLWQFPLPGHLSAAGKKDIMNFWDGLYGGRAAEELLRQLVLTLRLWRPLVVVSDDPRPAEGEHALEELLAEAVHSAWLQAGDPQAFSEQLTVLGLSAWRPSRLCAPWSATGATLLICAERPGEHLPLTPRQWAQAALGWLDASKSLPAQRPYRLLEGEGFTGGASLCAGLAAPLGARRTLPPPPTPSPAEEHARRQLRFLEQLAAQSANPLVNSNALLAQVSPALEHLPPDQSVPALLALARQAIQAGAWPQAEQLYRLLLDRYPADPATAEAYRWLIPYQVSAEVRRRYEREQLLCRCAAEVVPPSPDKIRAILSATGARAGGAPESSPPGANNAAPAGPAPQGKTGIRLPKKNAGPLFFPYREAKEEKGSPLVAPPGKGAAAPPEQPAAAVAATPTGTQLVTFARLAYLSNPQEARQQAEASLELGRRLAGLGPLYSEDPALRLCLLAARRQLGQLSEVEAECARLRLAPIDPAWRQVVEQEYWLTRRQGLAPRPVLLCRRTDTRPLLDGNLNDPCWQQPPALLQNASAATPRDYRTEVRLAYDQDFLYLALRCTHPAAFHLPPATHRLHDADLRPFDRVYLLLDTDRDYATWFRLQVDQRGCAAEDCWGDARWNPRWYLALRSTPTCWQVEAAFPLAELTSQPPASYTAWAVNVVRVLPGRGLQALSLPAQVEPQPEGMTLLLFTDDAGDPPTRASR
jgi:photosystem II stability/assembly factor-like uncharacterized protein